MSMVSGRTISEHRLVWEQAHGSIPAGMVIHHKDGNGRNNDLANLELLTAREHSNHHNRKHPNEKPCEACGVTFTPHPTKRARAKSCSPECRAELIRRGALARTDNRSLTAEQREAVRQRYALGAERMEDLAAEFGCSPATIHRAVHADR